MKKPFILKIALFACTLCFTQCEKALAQQNTSLAISPAIIEVNLKPGQIKNSKITVTNTSQTPLGVGINLAQVTPAEAEGLAVELKKPDWIKLSDQDILLKGGESREIEVITSPNKNTPPGGYYAMIYFQAAVPFSDFKLGATTAIPKLGAFMLIDLGGQGKKQFEILKKLDYPIVTSNAIPPASFTIKNTGNVHIIPSESLEFNRVGKEKQYKQGFPPVIVLPSTSRQITVPSLQATEPGIYKIVSISLKDSVLGFEREDIGYIIVAGKITNLLYILLVLLVFSSSFFIIKKRRNLRQAIHHLTKKNTEV